MDTLKYDLKLFLQDTSHVELEDVIPVLHRWIQTQQLEELLIDVTDYRHVHHGPGVILIAHDAHYALDQADGKMGLLYSRRRETHPQRRAIRGMEERLMSVFHCALSACQYLEAEASLQGRLQFRGDAFLLRLNDRLFVPTAEVYDTLELHLQPLLARLYPDCYVKVERVYESTTRPTISIKAPYAASVTTLLERLAADQVEAGVVA
jgi:hypothetical protein